MRTSVIVCLGALAVLLVATSSFAGHGCKSCGHRAHGHSNWGISTCANRDDAPVVDGAFGGHHGCSRGGCVQGCAKGCGSCRGGGCGNCHRGGLACKLYRYIKQSCKCNGCGPKYIPEWHNTYCEPCNRLGDWTGPSLHHGRPYVGPPRSGSNIGVQIYVDPTEAEAPPAKLPPKATIRPETSVKRVKRASYTSQHRIPRHRRAPAPTVRTIRVPSRAPQPSSLPTRRVIID